MKIKEIISEAKDISSGLSNLSRIAGDTLGSWADTIGKHVSLKGFGNPVPYKPNPNKKSIGDKDRWDVKQGIRKIDGDDEEPQDQEQSQDREQQQQRQQQQRQQRQEQPRPQGNPNQNINTKIEYLKSIGFLQSARITDDERQYIESTDVWVDTNKLQGLDPSTTFFQSRAPHHSMFIRQVVVPARDLGYENNVNYQFDLTPAGWWSSMHRAYVNPNSKLGRLVDDWADSHQG